MKKQLNLILKNVLQKINPPEQEMGEIDQIVKDFSKQFKEHAKKNKITAEVFIGGSFAKKTMIKKDYYDIRNLVQTIPFKASLISEHPKVQNKPHFKREDKTQELYDIDIFVRFDKKYMDKDISILTQKILKSFAKNTERIHGSRDYFNIRISPLCCLEIIPVMNINNPKEAQNITDLSYSHVNYINKKIKQKDILDEIKIAKAFCYANKCYGAESYINGFSGYSLELLVCYYGSFLKFIKELAKEKKAGKIVIDIEGDYKNKQSVLMDVNSSKLQSPIILIDPTFRQRNALAALSEETFDKFKKACRKFIKSPGEKLFEVEKTDLEKIKRGADKKKLEFILLEIKTDKQEGDIAGSKLFKFYNHLNQELTRFFDIKDRGFNYNDKHSARCYFIAKRKKEVFIIGPSVKQAKHVKAFERVHKNYSIRKGRVYAKENVNFSLRGFITLWKKVNAQKMKDMSVIGLEAV
ncbi:MAG: hypothetical protein KKA64_03350 [Nanoarchaeota archaeon]|nr:hypothetical protein [Nanoarchaeota archaeon]